MDKLTDLQHLVPILKFMKSRDWSKKVMYDMCLKTRQYITYLPNIQYDFARSLANEFVYDELLRQNKSTLYMATLYNEITGMVLYMDDVSNVRDDYLGIFPAVCCYRKQPYFDYV